MFILRQKMLRLENFNKETLGESLNLIALNIPARLCTEYLKTLKNYLFDRPRMKRIYNDLNNENRRLLVLGDKISSLDLAPIPDDLQEYIKLNDGKPVKYILNIGYDELRVDEVLRKVLPPEINEIPTAYEQVGHLAHLNLRDEFLPYKYLIGQVILDKNPILRTVVNKTGNIETEFRTFPMEVLAGEEDYDVTVKESGCTFTFNFKDVYWNSRLSTEHNRLVELIQEIEFPSYNSSTDLNNSSKTKKRGLNQDSNNNSSNNKKKTRSIENSTVTSHNSIIDRRIPIIADMMGGVGPFSIPLAKLNLFKVYSNDLNPESYKYLIKNANQNHCRVFTNVDEQTTTGLGCYNMDGRDFIRLLKSLGVYPNHVIMNLPQNATDFLDVFIGYLKTNNNTNQEEQEKAENRTELENKLPVIHVYAFSTAIDDLPNSAVTDIANRCALRMRCNVDDLGEQRIIAASGTKLANITLKSLKQNITNNSQESNENLSSFFNGIYWGHIVRDVAPTKVMVCLSFKLPISVALSD